MIEYRGYVGVVEYDPDIKELVGRVVNVRDVVSFRATSVDELEPQMQSAVDEYIAWCEELGRPPEKPLSGEFLVRTGDPALHGALSIVASRADMSLNAYVVRVLREHLAARHAAFGGLLLGDDIGQPMTDTAAPSGARKTRGPKRRAARAGG